MAERQRAAVEVDAGVVEAEFAVHGERLDGEGLVALDDLQVFDGELGAAQRLPGGGTGPMPMIVGSQPATAVALDAGQHLQAMRLA